MQSGKRFIIVIPIYRQDGTKEEIISLKRVIEVFPNYEFAVVCPHHLAITNYLSYFEEFNLKVDVQRFADTYFQSIEGYNQLMLSTEFYARFNVWNYILIHQLDCYLFKDEIAKWIATNYDYIGSPWLDQRPLYFYKSLIHSRWKILRVIKRSIDFNKGQKVFVGNGGFSLRKVQTFLSISRLLHIFFKRHLKGHVNEDYIWSILVTKYFSNFRVPSPSIASQFAVEKIKSEDDYNSFKTLPMACHAWEKYYPELLKSVITQIN